MTLKIDELVQASSTFARAFRHKSLDPKSNFERLEFLGDALIGSYVTLSLFKAYPKATEGSLSRWRASLVSQKTLAEISKDLKLSKYLEAKEDQKEELKKNERIQASLLESFSGALYVEKGDLVLKEALDQIFKDKVYKAKQIFELQDPKTLLQELSQKAFKSTPVYKKLNAHGESHAPIFEVEVNIKDGLSVKSKGSSWKEAEKSAAAIGLEKIKEVTGYEH